MDKVDRSLLEKPIPGLKASLTETQCNQLHKHALEAFPQECAGAVIKGRYVRLTNIAEDPEMHCQLSPEDIIRVTEEASLFCHSHPNGFNCPSGSDTMAARSLAVPHALVWTDGQACKAPVFFGDVIEKPPLLGRGFVHGFTDCFGLGLDFYKVIMGIDLPDFPRDWEWWVDRNLGEDGVGLYLAHFKEMGFSIVNDELRIGDVFLLKAGSRVPNHAGYYIGEHCMLHHLSGRMETDPSRLSTIEPLIRWQQHQRIDTVLRYTGGYGECSAKSGSMAA
jgi:cell wall-associated NlpC family hydrolase